MIPGSRPIVAGLWIALGLVGARARAQEPDHGAPVSYVARGPVFFAVLPATGKRVNARNMAVLQRRIPLDLHDASVAVAIDAIAERSGLEINYSRSLIAGDARVTLAATEISVAAALTSVLLDAGLDVQVTGATRATLVKRTELPPATVAAQMGGTITGHVTDGPLKRPLSDVSVRVEGTALRTTANAQGKYTITGVGPGTYRVTARRVGYQPLMKEITLVADQTATLDFALAAAPTRLDEVVTTAVGQQRRYEVGNDISTINADSIAPTAPITSLTDLISARAPGVTVLETSGMTGSGEAIRIEGLTSLVLQNDPILIVDGVRQDNSAGGDIASYPFGAGAHPTPTRLNDIDFSDIATIDILKGPAASTEYGTDAANGVIVIMTKHGSAGPPQWRLSAEQTESDIPGSFPTGYYSWGHTTDGTGAPVNCLLAAGSHNSAAGNCVVDSITQWNPLNHEQTSIFGTGNRAKYDLSVGGGSESLRYFVAGGFSNEIGIIQMPSVFRELADTAGLGLPRAALSPNSEQQRSVRVNTTMKLGATADLTAVGSYLSTYQQTPDAKNLYLAVSFGPARSDPAHYYGYDYFASPELTPLAELSAVGSQQTDRVTGGLTANWRPTGWFVGHVTVGLDHGSQRTEQINYPLANPVYQNSGTELGLADETTDVYSIDLRGTATVSLSRSLRAVSSGGIQMVDTRLAGLTAVSGNITATNLTLNGATEPFVTQPGTRQATLGGYGEEELSVADRLFVTGALRIDAASGFGRDYATAAYPKASLSWLAIEGAATTVRVRGAFGEAGAQPSNGAALQLYTATVAAVGSGGSAVSVNTINWPGNPNLQPERTTQFEGGLDVAGWANRINLALTGYSKTTQHALIDVNLGATLGNYTYQENVGEVRNTGVEGSVTVGVVRTHTVTWDFSVTGSVNHNILLQLSPGVTAEPPLYDGFHQQRVGYPLYGLWVNQLTYADYNRDGIIESGETGLADSVTYAGSSLPTREAAVSTHVGLWRSTVTLNALVDYRGGFKIADLAGAYSDDAGRTRQVNEPTAPLALQARAVANTNDGLVSSLDVEDGSFVRVREMGVTVAAPPSLARAVRAQSVSITAAVRNLFLWTRYTGIDPEVSNTGRGNIQAAPTTGGATVNNDLREDLGAVPLARYWVVRINVGL